MRTTKSLVLCVYSYLGNVLVFVPIIWNGHLCFDTNSVLVNKHANKTHSLWHVRVINGIIIDFKFLNYMNNSIRFMILYLKDLKKNCNILVDDVHYKLNDKFKLFLYNIKTNPINLGLDRDQNSFSFWKDSLNASKYLNWNTSKQNLVKLLTNDHELGIWSKMHSMNLLVLKKTVLFQILKLNTKLVLNTTSIPNQFPLKIIKINNNEGFIISDHDITHFITKQDNIITKLIKLDMQEIIIDSEWFQEEKLLIICTHKGNIYSLSNHNQTKLKVIYSTKYVNIKSMKSIHFNGERVIFIQGQHSPHLLLKMNNNSMTNCCRISEYAPILFDVSKSNYNSIYSVSNMNKGCNIRKFYYSIPTKSILSEPQNGFQYLSNIINVNNSLLVFNIAKQSRIRSLTDDFDEIEINGFDTDMETLECSYIDSNHLLQITSKALRIIHVANGLKSKIDINKHISTATIQSNFIAIVIDTKVIIYEMNKMNSTISVYGELTMKKEISCIKFIPEYNDNVVKTIAIGCYDGKLYFFNITHKPISDTACFHTLSLLKNEPINSVNDDIKSSDNNVTETQSICPISRAELYLDKTNGLDMLLDQKKIIDAKLKKMDKLKNDNKSDNNDDSNYTDDDDEYTVIKADLDKELQGIIKKTRYRNKILYTNSPEIVIKSENIDNSQGKKSVSSIQVQRVVHNVIIVQYDDNMYRLLISTRDGWLYEYNLIDILNQRTMDNDMDIECRATKIGELPIDLSLIKVDIHNDNYRNKYDLTQIKSNVMISCLCEKNYMWFYNSNNETELWNLDYSNEKISYIISFTNDNDEHYCVVISNNNMDIIEVIPSPSIQYKTIYFGKNISNLQMLNDLHIIVLSSYEPHNKSSSIHFIDKSEFNNSNDVSYYTKNNHFKLTFGADVISFNIHKIIPTPINVNQKHYAYYSAIITTMESTDYNTTKECSVRNILLYYDTVKKMFVKSRNMCITALKSVKSKYGVKSICRILKTKNIDEHLIFVTINNELYVYSFIKLFGDNCLSNPFFHKKFQDKINDLVYNSEHNFVSILFNKTGISLYKIGINARYAGMFDVISMNLLYKSWNGIHLSINHIYLPNNKMVALGYHGHVYLFKMEINDNTITDITLTKQIKLNAPCMKLVKAQLFDDESKNDELIVFSEFGDIFKLLI